MTELRIKYADIDRSIRWAIDAMYTEALDDIFRDWEKAEPRPSVKEVQRMIALHDDNLADAWEDYMEDYEGEVEGEDPDPDDAPSFSQAVEWLVREYADGAVWELYEAIDLERGRHRQADTSNGMVGAILYRQDRELAEGWTDWLRKNR